MWAAIFPGQGSQSLGMGKLMAQNFKSAKQTFEEAADAIHFDIKKLCWESSDQDLAQTENTQPALLTCSVATFRALSELSEFQFLAAAGHSIGEYAALVTAQSLSFPEAVRAVRQRGKSMQEAVPFGEGSMLACLGLDDENIRTLCTWIAGEGWGLVQAANFNAPGQVVLSGDAKALDRLKSTDIKTVLKTDVRVKFIPLQVSAPFHCQLMAPAEATMREVLSSIQFVDSSWPIVQNFTAQAENLGDKLRENLIRQVSAPVLWTQSVNNLKKLGIRRCIEFGSGKVLSGLLKKIDSDSLQTFNTNTLDDLRALERAWKEKDVVL